MILTLCRYPKGTADGIFGDLIFGSSPIAVTLEHAYLVGEEYRPKIPPGTYTCVRGEHLLHSTAVPFETFEIMGVPGHTGLLFHWGNWNRDSDGCILLGLKAEGDMILNSKEAFNNFMGILAGDDLFTLIIK